jgi:hypothetical protein
MPITRRSLRATLAGAWLPPPEEEPEPDPEPEYDDDAEVLFAEMDPEPDTARKELINDTIVALKNAGIWSKLDVLTVAAADSWASGSLNWIDPEGTTATLVNSIPFTQDRGVGPGDGSTQYVDTNINARLLQNYNTNDAVAFIYSRTNNTSDDEIDLGNMGDDGDGWSVIEISLHYSGNFDGAINTPTYSDVSSSGTLGSGAVRRDGSNSTAQFRNGSSVNTDNTSSRQPVSWSVYVGASNGGSWVDAPATKQYAYWGFGASLSNQELADLHDIMEGYLDDIGASVL